MVIGVLRVRLFISDAQSLKDKRRIIKSLIERIKNKFNLSVAETGLLDAWNDSELGLVCVSNEAAHSDRMMSSAIEFIENNGWVEITDACTELIHYSPS